MAFWFIKKIKNAIQGTLSTVKHKVSNIRETFSKALETESTKPTRQISKELTTSEKRKDSKRVDDVSHETNTSENFAEDTEIFKQWMRDAGDETLSPLDPGMVSAFFSLTRYIWNKPDIALADRLKAIVDYFDAPLSEIYNYVIKSQQMEDYLEQLMTGDYDRSPSVSEFAPYEVNGYQQTI